MKHIVIIGNSAAGIAAAEAVRKNNDAVRITIISEEGYPAYNRFMIADVLGGKIREPEIFYRKKEFYETAKINFLANKKVERVTPGRNQVTLTDKTKIGYDALIIASGAAMRLPKELKGANKHGVMGFRSMSAVKDLMELIPISHTACVWGSGLGALKAAHALTRKKLEVKIITESERILPNLLDAQAADFFAGRLPELGVEVITGQEISDVFGDSDVKAIKLAAGKVIGCGMLIVDRDFAANTRFLEETGLDGETGIPTDQYMRTSVANILTAGDVVQRSGAGEPWYDTPNSWMNAVRQGAAAGNNAAALLENKPDQMIAYEAMLFMETVELFDMPVVAMGMSCVVPGDGKEELLRVDAQRQSYKKVILRDSKIVGFVGIGGDTRSDLFSQLIRKQADVRHLKDALLTEQFTPELVKDLIA
ncbi:MAG: FAD-dependent oxidoreductase [Candidatus Omnitrophica bacterium]|nr:FAD-dependent oxidoreductase [Candidatus Omnitrophota bacterium]